MIGRATTLALACSAGCAAAQHTMQWRWTVGDTGDGDGVITPGESALLALHARCGGEDAVGFAGSVFDVLGEALWATGGLSVEAWNDALLSLGDLTPQANNDILAIDAFQQPPHFNAGFDASDPVWLFTLRWNPDGYAARVVAGGTTHLNHTVYTDEFGASKDLAGQVEGFSFEVVPGPGTAVVLLAGAGCWGRRRR